jgi:hypothetical protein
MLLMTVRRSSGGWETLVGAAAAAHITRAGSIENPAQDPLVNRHYVRFLTP